MHIIHFFSAREGFDSLEEFARITFSIMGVSSFEERESSNYVDGRYFKGVLPDLLFKIALSDEAGLEDMKFWVSIQDSGRFATESDFCRTMDSLLGVRLIKEGFRVVRVADFGGPKARRIKLSA